MRIVRRHHRIEYLGDGLVAFNPPTIGVNMRRIWLVILLVVAACSQTVPPKPPQPPKAITTMYTHDASFESVWSAAIDTLRERHMAVATIDKDSGLITSEWADVEADWEVEDKYADCHSETPFRPGYGVKTRMDVRVKPGTPTTISIVASFAELGNQPPLGLFGPRRGPVRHYSCDSRGVLEVEINNEIARRAASAPVAATSGQPPQARGFFCAAAKTTAVCARQKADCANARSAALGAVPDLAECTLVETAYCLGDAQCFPSRDLCQARHGEACVEHR